LARAGSTIVDVLITERSRVAGEALAFEPLILVNACGAISAKIRDATIVVDLATLTGKAGRAGTGAIAPAAAIVEARVGHTAVVCAEKRARLVPSRAVGIYRRIRGRPVGAHLRLQRPGIRVFAMFPFTGPNDGERQSNEPAMAHQPISAPHLYRPPRERARP